MQKLCPKYTLAPCESHTPLAAHCCCCSHSQPAGSVSCCSWPMSKAASRQAHLACPPWQPNPTLILPSCTTDISVGQLQPTLTGVSPPPSTPRLDCLVHLCADFRPGSFKPRLVPFRLGLEEAQGAFEAWQSTHWLAPRRVLGAGTSAVRPVLLPFWIFEATMQVHYTGRWCSPLCSKV